MRDGERLLNVPTAAESAPKTGVAADRVVRILVIEDHPIVVEGIKSLISADPSLQVIAAVPNVQRAIEALEACPAPDIALVDIALRDDDGTRQSGFDVIQWITDHPECRTRVIVLTMYDEPVYVLNALRRNVDAFVVKATDLEGLVKAIKTVHAGGRYVSPSLATVVADILQARERGTPVDPYSDLLTARERELVQLVGQGVGIKEIAERMRITLRTAWEHRANAKQKLGLKTTEEFAQWAGRRMGTPIR
jgi:DNA-binding NarL/FixJ family response regulator